MFVFHDHGMGSGWGGGKSDQTCRDWQTERNASRNRQAGRGDTQLGMAR